MSDSERPSISEQLDALTKEQQENLIALASTIRNQGYDAATSYGLSPGVLMGIFIADLDFLRNFAEEDEELRDSLAPQIELAEWTREFLNTNEKFQQAQREAIFEFKSKQKTNVIITGEA